MGTTLSSGPRVSGRSEVRPRFLSGGPVPAALCREMHIHSFSPSSMNAFGHSFTHTQWPTC